MISWNCWDSTVKMGFYTWQISFRQPSLRMGGWGDLSRGDASGAWWRRLTSATRREDVGHGCRLATPLSQSPWGNLPRVSLLNYYTSSPQRLMTPHFSQYLSSYLLISILWFANFILYVLVCTLGWRFTFFLKLLVLCVGVTKREGKPHK